MKGLNVTKGIALGLVALFVAAGPMACKKKDQDSNAKPGADERARRDGPKGERGNRVRSQREEAEAREERIKEMEAQKERERKVADLRSMEIDADLIAAAKPEAQESIDDITSRVGTPQGNFVVTIQDTSANAPTVVSASVTKVEGDVYEGTVVYIQPEYNHTQFALGDTVTVTKTDIVDWTYAEGGTSYGQYLRRAWLERHLNDEDEVVAQGARQLLDELGSAMPTQET